MDAEIRAIWLADLRSGYFTQGNGRLTRVTRDGTDEDCCLAVLCKQAVRAGIVTREIVSGAVRYQSTDDPADSRTATLPDAVTAWAGLSSTDPKVTVNGSLMPLSDVNDYGNPFRVIADLIEAQL